MAITARETKRVSAIYPSSIRSRPDYFVGKPGRYAVYYLVEQMMRSLLWGGDKVERGSLSLAVDTDGTLHLARKWSGETTVFPALGEDCLSVGRGSILASWFQKCVHEIGAGNFKRLDWKLGNPYLAIFVPVAGALAKKLSLKVVTSSGTFSQMYADGEPTGPIKLEPGGNEAALYMDLKLDASILQEDIPAYPFRIRLRELAALLPGLRVDLKYKGFKPLEFYFPQGIEGLLGFYVPVEDRYHEDPFNFSLVQEGLEYRCTLFLIRSEMERIKAFASLDETYHGGLHERILRRVVRQVIKKLHKLEIPERRQSCDNIASSRMSYFGKFGATVPYRRDMGRNEYVRTVPGVAAVIYVDSPELKWDTNYRDRLVGPESLKTVRPELLQAFRTWVLDQHQVIQDWHSQWAPKRRATRRRATVLEEEASPSDLDDVEEIAESGEQEGDFLENS